MITYKHLIPTEDNTTYKELEWSTLTDEFFKKDQILVMTLDDMVTIGYLIYHESHIYTFEIKKQFQGHGYGKQMLSKYEQMMVDDWHSVISLTPINKQVEEFYEKCGYELDVVGNREMFKIIGEE